MTLVELMVALTVSSLVLTAGFVAQRFILEQRGVAHAKYREVADQVFVRDQLIQWVSHAELSVVNQALTFRGLDGIAKGSADDQLTFFTSATTPVSDHGSVVRLFIDRSESTGERGLVAELSDRASGATRRYQLVAVATGLDIRYLAQLAEPRFWEASWVSNSVLPVAVSLALSAPSDSMPLVHQLPMAVALRGGR